MGKKYKNLFSKIVSIENIRNAYYKTVKGGNRYTVSHLQFKENIEANLYTIQKSIINGTYRHGTYRQFKVYEPKERVISALPFRDRVVQHSIFNIIEPIFEKVFYRCSYACRKGKGTHIGVRDIQSTVRRLSKKGDIFYLKMDFSKYFHSINGTILKKEIERKISDKKTLDLLYQFIGDIGINIGNLTSQLFANIYAHIFDRFIKTKLKCKYYFRYMDDTVILSNNKAHLMVIQKKLKIFIKIFMKLKFSKWYINPISKPLNFLGYRITVKYKLIRKDSVNRAKRKIKLYKKKRDYEKLKLFLISWYGHIKNSDSFNLKKTILKEIV